MNNYYMFFYTTTSFNFLPQV